MPLLIADPESAFLDTIPALACCFRAALRRRGVHILSDVEKLLRSGSLERLSRELEPALLKELLTDTAQEFSEQGLTQSVTYQGITDCLRELSSQGYKLALVSRTSEKALSRWAAQTSIGMDIEFMAAPTTTQPADWRRACLARLAEHGQFGHTSAVHISDDPFDIEHARNAGVQSVFAGYGRFPWKRVHSLGIGPVVHSPWQLTHRVLGAASNAIH